MKALSSFGRGLAVCVVCLVLAMLWTTSAHAYSRLGKPKLKPGQNIRLETGIVNNLIVDRYTWRDSHGRPRSASLVRFGQQLDGEPRGGYANQFSYQIFDAARQKWRTFYINPPQFRGDAGFGYFVSHELYRYLDANVCADGSNNCTIASLHGEDDSPLGLSLPGSGKTLSVTNQQAVHQFKQNYPHWGTQVPLADIYDPTPSALNAHAKYNLPVTIKWKFISGKDYPLWSAKYKLDSAPANTVSVDVRGPYGYMLFDKVDGAITKLEWGDQYKFATTDANVSTASNWEWNALNDGARYNLLVAGDYEFGLVQTIPYAKSKTGSGWSDLRGKTSAAGLGCPAVGWRMPCDWEWTYQSIQYENFDSNPSAAKKLAWGSAPYIGANKTSDDTGEPFAGYPKISYQVWITFDSSGGANTRALAASLH
ncbi:hypothetical protein FBQ82_12050 [Anaerolineae bacterium CFX7]|nr:hypothetical protein [Anaerolineae bacterium CFX7]